MKLHTPVTQLNRVGKVLGQKLGRLGVETVQDLLLYFPFRYEDYSQVTSIDQLEDGMQTTIQGTIELIANKRSPRKRMMITEAVVADETERLRVIWFGQPFITKQLKVGQTVFFSGKVTEDMFGVQMKNPAYERPKSNATTHTARIVPMYPLTVGVTQKQMRFLVSQIIKIADELDEWLPESILDAGDFVTYGAAVRGIHFPESQEELAAAEKRLKFDELFVLQLRAELIRQSIKRSSAAVIPFAEEAVKEFVAGLPFELTKDQKVAAWQILQDLERESPMNRLLEGDVGAGKTVVAALVACNAVLAGQQVAIMAPTEILAKQHYASLVELLPDQTVALLTSKESRISNLEISEKTKKKQREEVKGLIADGSVQIAIGTHALLTSDVEFGSLGLVVVDEQHRFGVEQRKIIREKSGNAETSPHFLSMTATPIPRSFALTLYGDLDLSVIKSMPAGRKPVKTRFVDPHNRGKAYDFIREQVGQGRQVFVICPMIGTDTSRDRSRPVPGAEKKSVLQEYEKLSVEVFPDLKIGYVHGKMKVAEKDEAMRQFRDHETDILVSTSVIEVGVDIPNASVMMIEGAESFGLAQLHQFRGRVGRSSHQSFCFLFSDAESDSVKERLGFFEQHTSGFDVAEYDLQMRGPGEVYGTNQSGMMQLRFATLQDAALIQLAREMARDIDFEEHPSLKSQVEEWEQRVHLE